ncbi:coiled-coil domain-containing protein 33-like isoform X2 [Ptychodera flava]|uniref:coiled-coil domain-containing protein 33-like isoform X2 n=1 Tax=Ptychodera flava TaxID=63121 RepID=UPI003969E882
MDSGGDKPSAQGEPQSKAGSRPPSQASKAGLQPQDRSKSSVSQAKSDMGGKQTTPAPEPTAVPDNQEAASQPGSRDRARSRPPTQKSQPLSRTSRVGSEPQVPQGQADDEVDDSPEPQGSQQHIGPLGRMHISRPGKDEIEIIVHGAASLPSLPDGRIPIPYVVGKSHSDDLNGKPAQSATHATLHPTHSPSFEEFLTVEVEEHLAKNESLILKVADTPSKERLAYYRIPVNYLVPFHQYHLELVQPDKYDSVSGKRLYATIMRKRSVLPRDPNFVYTGLEVFLRAMQREVANPVGPLIAVARVVPDYFSYKRDMLMRHPIATGITLTTVNFPDPHHSVFRVPPAKGQGYPQISLPGAPQQQPIWDHMYFFHQSRDNATIFSETAALIIEYYPSTNTLSDSSWHLRKPIGYSILLLDKNVYDVLIADSGRLGIRVEGLPIQETNLQTVDSKTPTVGMILRLITSERPDSLGSVSNPDLLPALDSLRLDVTPIPTPRTEPTPPTTPIPEPLPPEPTWMLARKPKPRVPIEDGKLPPHDALENVLPEYQYIYAHSPRRHPQTTPPPASNRRGDLIPTRLPPPQVTNAFTKPQRQPTIPEESTFVPIAKPPYSEEHALSLLDYQMKELENYRDAMKRMGKDILRLREEIARLEGENSQLRRQLHMHDDSTRAMLYASDLDGLSRAEIMERFLLLRRQLMNQTAETTHYKDKLQRLQNEIIKKNDNEKEYLRLQDAHMAQSAMLQKLQSKQERVKKLEDTMKEQENVIDKLERLLNEKIKNGQMAADKKSEAYTALSTENARLRTELEYMKMNPPAKASALDEAERMELYAKLDRAEGRIMSLEKQLESNARRWGKEKESMLIRMNENTNGFSGSSPVYLRDSYRGFDDSYLSRKPRRSKLDPL